MSAHSPSHLLAFQGAHLTISPLEPYTLVLSHWSLHSLSPSLFLSLLSYIPLSPTSLILMSLISKSVRRDHLADDVEAARADADARPEPTPMRCRKMLFPTQLQNRESRRRSCFDSTTLAIFFNQCQQHLAECPLSSLLPLINHWVPQKVTCTIN